MICYIMCNTISNLTFNMACNIICNIKVVLMYESISLHTNKQTNNITTSPQHLLSFSDPNASYPSLQTCHQQSSSQQQPLCHFQKGTYLGQALPRD